MEDPKEDEGKIPTIEQEPEPCRLCGIPFATQADLQGHIELHFENPYACEICEAIFHEKKQYDIHTREHLIKEEELDRAEDEDLDMNANFKEAFDLEKIIEQKEGKLRRDGSDDSIEDIIYPETITEKAERVRQWVGDMKKEQSLTPKKSQVITESTNLIDLNGNKIPKKVYQRKKTYPCEECNIHFKVRSNLEYHLKLARVHSKPGAYQCQKCPRTYASAEALKSHQLQHDENPKFKCKICGKAFMCTSTLKVHNYSHTGEKPFQCKKCDKGFTNHTGLKRHENYIHTGIRPFKCRLCNMAYVEKYARTKHISRVHPESFNGEMKADQTEPKYFGYFKNVDVTKLVKSQKDEGLNQQRKMVQTSTQQKKRPQLQNVNDDIL